ncbi:hypothetical protein EW145_g7161 [Phellinidium pouzarii]|uniref:Uncharacterized protein n=1 Tax=Phellinidium pouzarii TaxID=167371 RepID=A0A4S4KN38_9AGAM|nr:hypothetical protein EW145_g7161 [Phellinidium pouzarii]
MGPYGYRYPVHPPHAPSSSSSSSPSSDLSSPAALYGPSGGRVGGSSRRLEWMEPWNAATSGASARRAAVVDSAGGWDRVSDPLPMPGIGPGEQERVDHQQQQRVYPTSLPDPSHALPSQPHYYADMNPSPSRTHIGHEKQTQAVGSGYWRTSDLRNGV